MSLPAMIHSDGIKRSVQVKFAGYDRNLGASDGTFWDMKNMMGDRYPLIGTRNPRTYLEPLEKPNGIYGRDGLYTVNGTDFLFNGEKKGTVTDSEKTFVSLGAYVLVFPDKAYYNTVKDEFGNLEATWNGEATIKDGSYAGESANKNTITTTGEAFPFNVGDAVEISGSTEEANNKTAIIREMSDNKKEMRFYENTFSKGETVTITIKRGLPDMDFLCENENRLWGCKGDTIYSSALGDPFNFNKFDGISTDSYAVDVGSAGDFTGCISYLGYAIFFKENHIYKAYGNKPSNYQIMGSASLGVKTGCGKSLAVAGEQLFYLSRAGFVAYGGGSPSLIHKAFGEEMFQSAVAGSDGLRYVVSADGSLFVYDTRTGLWHRQDETDAVGFGWDNFLYCLTKEGQLFSMDGEEETFESMLETNDFTADSPLKKGLSRLILRIGMEAGSSLQLFVMYDSDGVWKKVGSYHTSKKKSFPIPLLPRRCDHFRLKLEGSGQWNLYSMTKELYEGSDLQ